MLLVPDGPDRIGGPAIDAARTLGIPVIGVAVAEDAPAGVFTLRGEPVGPPRETGFAGPDDVALVLHTSGTTSRPKIVPLSQRNLCASAAHIGATLQLGPGDRCLNVMPLFHIHGLMAATLSLIHISEPTRPY